jgi:hypothetical protein
MTLLCLKDNYTHEGRALLEDLNRSAMPESVRDARGAVISLGRTFKQLNAPVGQFGADAISVSTRAIKGDASTYSSLEGQLQTLVTRRDALAADIEAQLDTIPGCGGFATTQVEEERRGSSADSLEQLNARARQILQDMRRLAGGRPDDGPHDSNE